MIYRRRASPMHAARAAAAGLYGLALAVAALAFEHPLVLATVTLLIVAAGALAGVGRELGRSAAFTIPLALLIALVNPFVVREGITVFARLGEVPAFGQVDLTVEALVYGLLLGARVVAVVLACALLTAAVDPDEVLRLFRRVSFRSALTAALAVRLVPVLARDGRRLAQAAQCRPKPAGRPAVLRAVATSALDRAVDVAATLEVRGYAAPVGGRAESRPARAGGPPWSRHDVAFAAAGVVLLALVTAAKLAGMATFSAYPRLEAAVGPAEVALCAALALVALLPFADRRGIER